MCPGRPGTGGCTSVSQGKVRLWVNPDRDRFHCWHCGFAGGSLAVLMVRGSVEWREYLEFRQDAPRREREEAPSCAGLPVGFTPFGLSGSRNEGQYLSYLRARGVSERTVVLYRMGYVDDGPLTGRVVVPSFDRHGSVNFWSARSIRSNVPHTLRYRLPSASKDIISNEHMVNWSRPVYLVEGIFDEIAIGAQAISLYGKSVLSRLVLRLVQERPPVVHVCLDSDAWDEAEDIAGRLMGYDIPCSVVILDGKDPAQVGPEMVALATDLAPMLTGSIECMRERLRNL